MVKIDEKAKKYTVKFKRKDLRINQRDDKFELFRNIIGLEDTSNIFQIQRYTGNRKAEQIRKNTTTITDNNSFRVPFITARLTEEQVSRLRKNPDIEYIAEDGIAYSQAQVTPWGINKVAAPSVWPIPLNTKGEGAIVAVIDTGCDSNHPDLRANIKINQSFLDNDASTISKDVPNHHGTHVMGTVLALDNGEGVVGVAPLATGWNLRAGDQNGAFQFTDIVEGIEYAKENGAHIINCSIGALGSDHPPTADSLKDAYDNNGIIICAAEGNQGVQTSTNYMSRYYGTLGVSNIQEDNNLHSTSNYGPNTDFTCPGANVNSTGPNNTYHILTGTSMATPHLSGLCALALSSYADTGCPPYIPGLKRNKVVEQALISSVDKLGKFTTEKDIRYGYGLPLANRLVATMKGVKL